MMHIPGMYQKVADYSLAGILVMGPLLGYELMELVNQYLIGLGGVVGIALGVVRIWLLIRNRNDGRQKDED